MSAWLVVLLTFAGIGVVWWIIDRSQDALGPFRGSCVNRGGMCPIPHDAIERTIWTCPHCCHMWVAGKPGSWQHLG